MTSPDSGLLVNPERCLLTDQQTHRLRELFNPSVHAVEHVEVEASWGI